MASIFEHVRQRDLEAGKNCRRQHVACLARKLERSREAIPIAAVDADHIDIGVGDPVFEDVCILVQAALDRFVSLASAGRRDLYNQVWRSRYVLACERRQTVSHRRRNVVPLGDKARQDLRPFARPFA